MLAENEGHVRSKPALACPYVRFDIQWKGMSPRNKPLVWLHGEIKMPPFTKTARIEAGYLLREATRDRADAATFETYARNRFTVSRTAGRG
jgi:hypothetical protein